MPQKRNCFPTHYGTRGKTHTTGKFLKLGHQGLTKNTSNSNCSGKCRIECSEGEENGQNERNSLIIRSAILYNLHFGHMDTGGGSDEHLVH